MSFLLGLAKAALNFIPGGGLITTALSWLSSHVGGMFKTWADRDVQLRQADAGTATAIGTAAVGAEVQVNHDRLEMLKSFKATQYLIVMALFPVLLHQGMVFLDSTPFPYPWGAGWWPSLEMHQIGTWHVARLPGVYEDREWLMIAALLGLSNINSIATGVLRWMHK